MLANHGSTHLELHRGDPASSSFISESQPGGLLHAPLRGLALSRPSFPARDYPRKTDETTWSGFDRVGIGPIWSYGEALALVGSDP
jgi:hypothetical protein